jgi:hypothetical protein
MRECLKEQHDAHLHHKVLLDALNRGADVDNRDAVAHQPAAPRDELNKILQPHALEVACIHVAAPVDAERCALVAVVVLQYAAVVHLGNTIRAGRMGAEAAHQAADALPVRHVEEAGVHGDSAAGARRGFL